MDAHEHEPSYYEVALTNRQVVTGFVILLVCLFAAFLSGVWLGREAGGGERIAAASPARAAEAGEAKLEQLTFFGDRAPGNGARRTAPTAPPAAATAPAATSTAERAAPTLAESEAEKLRQTLEAEMAQHRTDLDAAASGGAAVAPAPAAPAPVGSRLRRKADPPAPATSVAPPAAASPASAPAATSPAAASAAASSAAAAAPIWIQVYSSGNGAKAQELASRLKSSGFQAIVLEAAGGAGSTFRVRVGPYARRDDADRAASRLRRDHRLDTWVTDQP